MRGAFSAARLDHRATRSVKARGAHAACSVACVATPLVARSVSVSVPSLTSARARCAALAVRQEVADGGMGGRSHDKWRPQRVRALEQQGFRMLLTIALLILSAAPVFRAALGTAWNIVAPACQPRHLPTPWAASGKRHELIRTGSHPKRKSSTHATIVPSLRRPGAGPRELWRRGRPDGVGRDPDERGRSARWGPGGWLRRQGRRSSRR